MSLAEVEAHASGQIMVARQVIMDRRRQVWGYDLLYRTTGVAARGEDPSSAATARLLADAITAIGLDTLADGRRAFIRLDDAMLTSGVPTLAAPERIVFVLGADLEPTAAVLSACRQLREQRYGLAATLGANPGHLREWLRVADVLRVDVTTHRITKPDLQRLLSAAGPRSVAPMATQVETQVQFGRALDAGFEYFQGFFFGEPTIKEGRAIPAPQLTRLKLAQALQDPDLSIDEIEALVKPDAALCYRTLRTVNSAAVPHGNEIKSIREALLRVGRDPIRRWAALWAFSEIGAHASTELLTLSAIRGRFCELLAERAKTPIESSEAFLLGLCSLLDAILERSMTDLVVELPLPTDVRDALLGRDNPMRALLDCATAYGSGEWERAGALAAAQGVDGSVMPKLWVDALRWSRALRTQA